VNTIRKAFPKLSLEFLPKERDREAGEFAQRCVKVVLMTKFIGHPSQNAVPPHKRVLITGGTTKLRQWLERANLPTVVKPQPKKKEELPMVPTDKKIDYSALMTCAIGKTVAIKRPPHTTLAQFEAKITASRSYYWRHHGIKTTASFQGEVAVLTVVARADQASTKALLPDAESPAAKYFPPAVTEESQANYRMFWQQVLVARASNSMSMADCITAADEALVACKNRFGAF
jgi:hypothetical protein